jgi:hypothetical protein
VQGRAQDRDFAIHRDKQAAGSGIDVGGSDFQNAKIAPFIDEAQRRA